VMVPGLPEMTSAGRFAGRKRRYPGALTDTEQDSGSGGPLHCRM
jgi:hypothetical protein